MRRLAWLDGLRVVAAFAVVLLHVSAMVVATRDAATPAGWWVACSTNLATRWAVPVFIMISGALLLDPSRREEGVRGFYKRRLSRWLIPIAFWSAVYLAMGCFLDKEVGLAQIGSTLLNGVGHLWFLYVIGLLYLFTPFARVFTWSASAAQRRWLIGIILSLAILHALADRLLGTERHFILTRFVPFMGYFLCGYECISADLRRVSVWTLVAILLAGLATAVAGTALLGRWLDPGKDLYFGHSFSPTVVALSIAVFLLARKLGDTPQEEAEEEKDRQTGRGKLLAMLAQATLGIYVLHPAIVGLLKRLCNFGTAQFAPAVGIPLVTVVVFAISAGMSLVMLRIPFVRRTIT